MNIEALSRLEVLLRTVPRASFNLCEWFVEDKDCGTIACACGHATRDPWFNEQGFSLTSSQYMPNTIIYKDNVGWTVGWDAIITFFGISNDDAFYLFDSSSYEDQDGTTPIEVANRIHDFLISHKDKT